MSVIKKLGNNLKRVAKNNLSLAIYSVIIAILVWLVVTITLYPSVPKTIDNVTLKLDISGSTASENGLSIISCDVEKVNVKIKGSRTQVGNLNSDSLEAYIDAENVSTAGKKTLNIRIRSNSDIKYEVESVTPSTASVVFDRYDNIEIPVSPKLPNVKFAKGKTLYNDEFTCEPEVIRVTGPSSQLEKISKCYAVSNKNMTLDSSYTLSSDSIELYSSDNVIIDQSLLKFDTTSFIINIPVLTQATVKLRAEIVNSPSSFNTESIKLKYEPESITIASKNSQAEFPEYLEIGEITLSSLDIGYSASFDVSKALSQNKDLINISDIETVTVSLNDENLEKRSLRLDSDHIRISNAPDNGYEYNILTAGLNIDIIAPADIIDEISNSDFYATANLLYLDPSVTTDQFPYDVTLSCTKYDNVWAVTRSSILIQRTEKPKAADKESTEEDIPLTTQNR